MTTYSEIRKKYGKNAKIAFVFRHGKKTPDNHITAQCIANITESGIVGVTPDVNILHMGSALVRTKETVEALKIWLLEKGAKIRGEIHADENLGSDELFNCFTPEIRETMKTRGLTNYEAVKILMSELFDYWQKNLKKTFNGIFDLIEPSDFIVVPCHSPTVEMAYNLYADEPDEKIVINELEGIFLVQDEAGKIIALR